MTLYTAGECCCLLRGEVQASTSHGLMQPCAELQLRERRAGMLFTQQVENARVEVDGILWHELATHWTGEGSQQPRIRLCLSLLIVD